MVVADEDIAGTRVVQGAVLLEFTGGAGLGFLALHGGVKTGCVHLDVALAADIVGEVQRKTVGVVQLEGHFSRHLVHATGQGRIQNLHARFQRLIKPLFLHPQRLRNALLIGLDFGIRVAHQPHQVCHQLVEKRRFLPQLVAMADRAAHDAALYIATPFVAG